MMTPELKKVIVNTAEIAKEIRIALEAAGFTRSESVHAALAWFFDTNAKDKSAKDKSPRTRELALATALAQLKLDKQ